MTQVLVVPERRLKLFEQMTGLGSLVETFAELGLVKIQKDVRSDDEQGNARIIEEYQCQVKA